MTMQSAGELFFSG